MDDQNNADAAAKAAVNPSPDPRNFKVNNSRHKILVAVIDTGTDYNQPFLLNNIHFYLDSHDQPAGTGYDFVANDLWPAPYVARTLDRNRDADLNDRLISSAARLRVESLAGLFPKISAFDSARALEQEADASAHGTMTAGLSVYDLPEAGLIPFRVLPINKQYKNGQRDYSQNKESIIFKNMMGSLELAARLGVRVVNMSLAFSRAREGGGGLTSTASPAELAAFDNLVAKVVNFANKHPNMVLVTSSGNEGQWVDGVARRQLPCGASAPNIICVGATGKDGRLASFSNIILSDSPFVAAPGTEIVSLFPTKMCDSDLLRKLNVKLMDPPFDTSGNSSAYYNELGRACQNWSPFKKSSGTSFAAPIVARALTKILIRDASLSGAEAVKSLMDSGKQVQYGQFKWVRLRLDRPSWYPKPDQATQPDLIHPISLTHKKSGNDYFEFYVANPDDV